MSALTKIEIIAFDADDTLWHNENLYHETQDKFKELLLPYHNAEWIDAKLYETESRNLQHFGYGVKGFTLSMIETAIELSEGRISGAEIQSIINLGREMLRAPIELLDGVRETIAEVSESYQLMLITKGDLLDQETKLARSGLGDYFTRVEVVSEKKPNAYQRIFSKYNLDPQKFLMVGNSVKSDILPVLTVGGRGVHIPYCTTWIHERVPKDELADKEFIELEHIRLLPDFLKGIL